MVIFKKLYLTKNESLDFSVGLVKINYTQIGGIKITLETVRPTHSFQRYLAHLR